MASLKLEERLEEQVYFNDKYYACKINDKTPFISHWRKSRELIIAKKKEEMPQITMNLNCQNHWKETKVCDFTIIM
jgi:hypothetical protein